MGKQAAGMNDRHTRETRRTHESLYSYVYLAVTLARRSFSQRFRGSLLGALWPLVSTLALLLIYSMVFSIIFQARWKQVGIEPEAARDIPFWLILLIGQVLYMLVAEMLNQSPSLVLAYPSYVKKIRFPLAILPVVSYLVASFTAAISLAVMLVIAVALGVCQWTALLLPAIFLPLTFWSLGIGWLLSALGVFFRDLQMVTPLISQLLLFGTPIFYSMSMIPEKYAIFFHLNPLAYMVETARGLILWGTLPNWGLFALWTIAGVLFAVGSLAIFNRLRGGFADVM